MNDHRMWYVLRYGSGDKENKSDIGIAQLHKGIFHFIGVKWTRTCQEVDCLAGPFSPQDVCDWFKFE